MTRFTSTQRGDFCRVPELLELGKMIEAAVEPLAERVWIVISADLSHVHPAGTMCEMW